MKFNVTFQMPVPDKKGKTNTRQIEIEAPNDTLAEEWGRRQAAQWGNPNSPFEVTPPCDVEEHIRNRDKLSPGFAKMVEGIHRRKLEEAAAAAEVEAAKENEEQQKA